MSQHIVQSLNDIYTKLNHIGYDEKFIRKSVLPEWWDDRDSDDPTDIMRFTTIVSRNLGLDVHSLMDKRQTVKPNSKLTGKFKMARNLETSEVINAQIIAASVAKYIVRACKCDYKGTPETGKVVNDTIIAKYHHVELMNLVDYCWSMGIPVIYIKGFDKKYSNMDGMALYVEGRPVIILNKHKQKKEPWYLFTLAHELAHIIAGHVNEETTAIVDNLYQEIDDKKPDEEFDANDIATEILTGNRYTSYNQYGRILNGQRLASFAMGICEKERVSPGFVVLNYANVMTEGSFTGYPTAQKALKIMGTEDIDTSALSKVLHSYIDIDEIPEESQHFVTSMV